MNTSADWYVKNISSGWVHAMKRSIGPGAEIPIDELYAQYGIKYGINEGEDFVKWLRNVKLKDTRKWKIVAPAGKDAVDYSEKEKTTEETKERIDTGNVAPMVSKKMEVGDVVDLSVRNAREVIPTIKDLHLLKYALQEANQLSGKDSLCRIIRKRILEIQSSR